MLNYRRDNFLGKIKTKFLFFHVDSGDNFFDKIENNRRK